MVSSFDDHYGDARADVLRGGVHISFASVQT